MVEVTNEHNLLSYPAGLAVAGVALVLSAASFKRSCESMSIAQDIKDTGKTTQNCSPNREARIARVVLGNDVFKNKVGRWRASSSRTPKVRIDDNVTIIEGYVVDDYGNEI